MAAGKTGNNSNGEMVDPLINHMVQPSAACDDSNSDPSDGKQKNRRVFAWGNLRFTVPSRRKLEPFFKKGHRLDAWCGLAQYVVESFVYLLGPVLICLASSIIGLLVYTYFAIIMDMMRLYYADTWYGSYIIHTHTSMVIFLLINVVFNYALCVVTSNTKGKSYDNVMREMAAATGFIFPETPAQVEEFRKDYEERMILRMQCRRQRALEAANRRSEAMHRQGQTARPTPTTSNANGVVNSSDNQNNSHIAVDQFNGHVTHRKNITHSNANQTTPIPIDVNSEPPLRPWMMMGPYEWGFCNRTRQPKPPRSHYCHVSHGLVFCLDHYCPWMFNSVGYFNYRYFVNFLIFACVSMLYGACLSYAPFILLSTTKYREQLRSNKQHFKATNSHIPLPRLEPFLPYQHEKMYITLTFMLSLAVGLAVAMLCLFHLYLTMTSQTTIEFHGNYVNKRRAKKVGKKWKNPYSLGWKRNFQQVYGYSMHPLLALIIPSAREPEFLPIPMPGDQSKRSTYASTHDGGKRNKGDFVV